MTRLLRIAFLSALLLVPQFALANEGGGEGGEGGGEGAKAEEAKGPQFVPVGPVTVPIIRNGRIYQYVRITVKLETKDGADAKVVTSMIPALTDAYLTSLYGAFYVGEGMSGPLVDIEKIKNRLTTANQKVLPDGVVQNILIQQISQSSR